MELVARAQHALVGGPRHTVSGWVRGAGPILRRHWLFAAFVVVAVGLRAVVSVAYWPALELHGDSYDYLRLARVLEPGTWHTSGYPLLLALLSLTGWFGSIVVLQHLMGIAMGLLVYLFALRLGARRWLAAIAALPILLDGYALDLEQFVLAETFTNLLLLGSMAVLLWRDKVGGWRGAAVGLLLAAATLTRADVLPVLIVVVLYLLVRGGRWRGLLACCAVAAVVLAGYGGWYAAVNGRFGYSDFTGFWLYGRVAPFATCHYPMPRKLAKLCPPRPVGKRSDNPEYFTDGRTSPIHAWRRRNQYQRNVLGEQFAIDVIEHQPLAYADAFLSDTWHYFTPGHWMTGDRIDMRRWVFPPPHFNEKADNYHVSFATKGFSSRIKASPDPALMGPLRTYQSVVYTPGPLLLACLIGALAIALGLARRRVRRRHVRWAAMVLAVSSVVVILTPSMIAQFSYRYGLPLLVLLPPAGALAADVGLDALARSRLGRRLSAGGRRRPTAAMPLPAWRGVGDGLSGRHGTASNGDGAGAHGAPQPGGDPHDRRAL